MIERLERIPGAVWLALLIFLLPELARYLEQYNTFLGHTDAVVGLILLGLRLAIFIRDSKFNLSSTIVKTEPVALPPTSESEAAPDNYPIRKIVESAPERSPLNRFLLGA